MKQSNMSIAERSIRQVIRRTFLSNKKKVFHKHLPFVKMKKHVEIFHLNYLIKKERPY